MKRWIVLPVLLGVVLTGGVCDPGSVDVFPELEERFSFEGGLEGWSAAASDLGEPPTPWRVSVSTAEAFAGSASASLFLDNGTGQGRVFLRRRFDGVADTDYRVELSFQLGTSDVGPVNVWNLIGGASREAPSAGGGLITIGDTEGGGSSGDVHWVERTATFDLRTGVDDGRLWVGLGIWGTSAFAREYFLDDLRVIVRRR